MRSKRVTIWGVVLDLAELFGAAVQVADVWLDLDDALAVDPQHHAEDAVRAGVLRPHVDHEVDGVEGVSLCGLCIGLTWLDGVYLLRNRTLPALHPRYSAIRNLPEKPRLPPEGSLAPRQPCRRSSKHLRSGLWATYNVTFTKDLGSVVDCSHFNRPFCACWNAMVTLRLGEG